MGGKLAEKLRSILKRIDARGYKAYKEIEGSWSYRDFTLHVDHVQGDPFADPSRLCVEIETSRAGIPAAALSTPLRRSAAGDYFARAFRSAIASTVRGNRGIGKSGQVTIAAGGGQEILESNAVVFTGGTLQCRFVLGLPARGRTILGRQAEEMLFDELPRLVEEGLDLHRLPPGGLERHLASAEDQDALRRALTGEGLVAFVAEGATLPRQSGIDPRPLREGARPFVPPPDLTVELPSPHRGPVRGMGIPAGVTLIVGGGFHGKSTLLDALQVGVYNHIPGDGRELVVAIPSACKVRAEDGRAVEGVDISPFISNLPTGQETAAFTTANASGSTSQAAAIVEPLEVGCRLLLVDEDTSATNFMIRDERMQELVHKDREPITPFVDKVRQLHRERDVSTILVMGGSGEESRGGRVLRCRPSSPAAAGVLRSLPGTEGREDRHPPGGDHTFRPFRHRRHGGGAARRPGAGPRRRLGDTRPRCPLLHQGNVAGRGAGRARRGVRSQGSRHPSSLEDGKPLPPPSLRDSRRDQSPAGDQGRHLIP
jgi:predicted ABC-class ATPase